MPIQIFPSILASNLLNIKETLEKLDPICSGYHLDIMDFHFVPNLTFGPPIVNPIAKRTKLPLWVHLMVDNPQKLIPLFDLRANDIVSVHVESASPETIIKIFKNLKSKGCITSLALNPKTPVTVLEQFVGHKNNIDQILVMSVEPGFSGQAFIQDSYQKLTELNNFLKENNFDADVTLDGGVGADNIAQLDQYNVKAVAVGSALFNSKNIVENYEKLESLSK